MDETFSLAEAARELCVTDRRVYQLMKDLEMTPAIPGRMGRGKGARLSREQVEQLRAHRVARLEADLRKAKGEG